MLAKKVVFFGGCQRSMTVGSANQAELVGIGTESCLDGQAAFQRFASVFAGQHVVGLGFRNIEIANIPGLVIRKLVVRRQEGMGFAIALDLGGFVQRFPPCRAG